MFKQVLALSTTVSQEVSRIIRFLLTGLDGEKQTVFPVQCNLYCRNIYNGISVTLFLWFYLPLAMQSLALP